MTNYQMTWAQDNKTSTDYFMPSKNGAQIKDDEWAMRAFSFNGTQLCTFLNGEQSCIFPKKGFNCDRVNSLYVAPMSKEDMYVHKIEISQVRVFSPALSLPSLTRMYYKE